MEVEAAGPSTTIYRLDWMVYDDSERFSIYIYIPLPGFARSRQEKPLDQSIHSTTTPSPTSYLQDHYPHEPPDMPIYILHTAHTA